ncbi:MAG: RNA polymerase factor sigma-54 [Candidatus Sumerlaeia bacterium]
MALSLRQVQKMSQRLIMTPQMQQSIKLLQMNTLELEQLAQQEMLANPFLELEQEEPEEEELERERSEEEPAPTDEDYEEELQEEASDHQSSDRDLSEGSTQASDIELTPPEAEASFASGNGADLVTAGEDDADVPPPLEDDPNHFDDVDCDLDQVYDDGDNFVYTQREEYEEHSYENYVAAPVRLADHLMHQLSLLDLTEREKSLCAVIVGCLNDDGYFKEDLADLARRVGAPEEDLLHALEIVQTLDPPGVGARTLQECLQIQLERTGELDPLMEALLGEDFPMLARHWFKELARKHGRRLADITAAFERIRRLEPKPGRQFSGAPNRFILPDVYVDKIDGEYVVTLNEGETAALRLNRSYARLLRENNFSEKDKEFAREKYKAAVWLLRNIERRKSTILKIARKIVEFQREFFDKGIEYLRPLNLRDIAEAIQMHETTVARVTSSKYMQTPRGIFPMKFFFPSGVSTQDGGDASSLAIKAKLKELIEHEDPRKPLSDQKIATILQQQGINIARRTVAKYREEIKILPSKLRRKL